MKINADKNEIGNHYKVIILNGSPKAYGNTAMALHEVECTLQQQGIDTEWIHVGPQIKTGMELIECVEDYCYGVEDLSAAKGKKSESLQIYVPMNNNLKGSEETLYLQAFVLNLEDEPKMLAKSSVVKISFEKLSTLVPKIDQDKITKDIERNMLGEILMGIFTNPDAVDDEGYKPCPKCHGKGKIQEDSWSHAEKQSEPRVYTTSTCEECDGTGRVKATEGDIEMKRSMKGLLDGFGISGGDVFDIFFGPQ